MIDWKANKLDVYIWDVAHGLSITIITPYVQSASGILIDRRRVIQIDAGVNFEYKFFPVMHLLGNHGLPALDCFIISHVDKDHIDELPLILKLNAIGLLPIHSIIRNKSVPNHSVSEEAEEEVEAKSAYRQVNDTYIYPVDNHNLLSPLNFGGVEVMTQHLFYIDNMPGKLTDHNDLSVVTSIKFGPVQVMIPGDLGEIGARSLINLGWMPQADLTKYRILIAPHHGSYTAKPAKLLRFYKPHIVLASAERDHEYTDPLYSNAEYVIGHLVTDSNGINKLSRFNATKGEAIHIET